MAGMGHRLANPAGFLLPFKKIGQKQSDFHGTSRNAMQITRATDYAVRIMVHMASLPQERRVPLSELAEASGAPDSFVSKVLQRLALRGMVTSNRGRGGGFQLAVDAEDTSLLQVVEAIEGPLQINLCLPGELSCDRKSWCAVHPVWNEAQAALKQVLASVSIARMARESAANLAAAENPPEAPNAEAEFVPLSGPKRWPG
jgi:Rrf2 family protein